MKRLMLPLALYGLSILLIALAWWALGRPAPMPALAGDKVALPCLSYAPFRGEQSPLVGNVQIERGQIAEDLAHLATRTACIRTYGVNHGTHVVPELAKEAGLKVMLGIWLGADPASNRQQIDSAIDLARRYPEVLSAVVVGNEVLLRGEMTPPALAAALREVRAAVPVSVPVTYADVPEFWLRHPELANAVDFITIHLLPYWEDFPTPVAAAVAHAEASRQKIVAAFPGRQVFVGEIGWPSAGRMREGALPSRVNQARFFHEVMALAEREQFGVNLIEAFDQPWKRQREGTVGGYWGLFDAEQREAKFAWGQPVTNHPFWVWQAGLGVLLASLTFLAGAWSARASGGKGARRKPRAWPGWGSRPSPRSRAPPSAGRWRPCGWKAWAWPVGCAPRVGWRWRPWRPSPAPPASWRDKGCRPSIGYWAAGWTGPGTGGFRRRGWSWPFFWCGRFRPR